MDQEKLRQKISNLEIKIAKNEKFLEAKIFKNEKKKLLLGNLREKLLKLELKNDA